jgi:hypothetical protein
MSRHEVELGYVLKHNILPGDQENARPLYINQLSSKQSENFFSYYRFLSKGTVHVSDTKEELKKDMQEAIKKLGSKVPGFPEIRAQKLVAYIETLELSREDIETEQARRAVLKYKKDFEQYYIGSNNPQQDNMARAAQKDSVLYLKELLQKAPDVLTAFGEASSGSEVLGYIPFSKSVTSIMREWGLSKEAILSHIDPGADNPLASCPEELDLERMAEMTQGHSDDPVILAKISLGVKGHDIAASSVLSWEEITQARVEGRILRQKDPELERAYKLLKSL